MDKVCIKANLSFQFLILLISGCIFSLSVCCNTANASQFPATDFYQGDQLRLAQAIENGDLEGVKALAPQTDMHTIGQKGMTMLHYALLQAKNDYSNTKRHDVITALMKAGADYYQESPPEGDTPLSTALLLAGKYPLLFKAMLNGGLPADATLMPKGSQTLIFGLLSDDSLEALDILIKYGADVNKQDSIGYTPIFNAYYGLMQFKVIDLLLDSGANPEIPQQSGITFSYAVYEDLNKMSKTHLYRKDLERVREHIIEKGGQWPPRTPLEERELMREKGLKVVVPHGETR